MDEMMNGELREWVAHLMQGKRSHKYILDRDHNPVIEIDINEWGHWLDIPSNRRVSVTKIGEVTVSTVFLGYDHNILDDDSPPILFETMVFGDTPHSSYLKRYCTWDEAKKGHEVAVLLVRGGET